MKSLIYAVILASSISAASAAQWQQTAAAANPAAMAQARCQLLASGRGGGFYAYGSTGFVVGATIGNILAEAVAQSVFINQCMRALGYEPIPRARNPSSRGTGNADMFRGSTSK